MTKPEPLKKIYYSSDFKKSLKKAPPNVQRKADKRLKIFKKNAFDPRLNSHKRFVLVPLNRAVKPKISPLFLTVKSAIVATTRFHRIN